MSRKDFFVKVAIRGTALFLLFEIFRAMREQRNMDQAIEIKAQKRKYGKQFQLTEEKQQILNEAEHYLKNHAGLHLLARTRSKKEREQDLQSLIRQKESQLDQLIKNDGREENIMNVQHQLKLLAEIFHKTQRMTNKSPEQPICQDSDGSQKKQVYFDKI